MLGDRENMRFQPASLDYVDKNAEPTHPDPIGTVASHLCRSHNQQDRTSTLQTHFRKQYRVCCRQYTGELLVMHRFRGFVLVCLVRVSGLDSVTESGRRHNLLGLFHNTIISIHLVVFT